MANALVTDISNALKDLLNTNVFTPAITPLVKYRPTYSIQELSQLRVTICPRGIKRKAQSRNLTNKEVAIDIAVQKKIVDEEADLPALLELVESILDFVEFKVLSGSGFKAAWIGDENDPIYDPIELRQSKVFQSILSFTFAVS